MPQFCGARCTVLTRNIARCTKSTNRLTMAESPSVHSARSQLSPQGNDENVAEVLAEVVAGNLDTPMRRTRLFDGHSEEQHSTSSPSSPRYLTRSTAASHSLIEEDVAEDDNEEGDGDSKASAEEMDDIDGALSSSTRDRLQVLIKVEDDTDEAALDEASNQVHFDLTDLDENQFLTMHHAFNCKLLRSMNGNGNLPWISTCHDLQLYHMCKRSTYGCSQFPAFKRIK